MSGIVEFLEARIAEDEEDAQDAIDPEGWGTSTDGRWRLVEVPYEGEWPRNPDAEGVMWADREWAIHASRHHPARVLAECTAKRAIMKVCDDGGPWPSDIDRILNALAAVYADHPDYQQEAWG